MKESSLIYTKENDNIGKDDLNFNSSADELSITRGRKSTMATAFRLSYNSDAKEETEKFLCKHCKELGILKWGDDIIDVDKEKGDEEEKEEEKEKKEGKKINISTENTSYTFLIVDLEKQDGFEENFHNFVESEFKGQELINDDNNSNSKFETKCKKGPVFELKKVEDIKNNVVVLYSDNVNKENPKVKFTERENFIIQRLVRGKWTSFLWLTKAEQKDFAKKLVLLGDDKCKAQREKTFGLNPPNEYRFVLNSILTSRYLSHDALITVVNFLVKREVSATDSENMGQNIDPIEAIKANSRNLNNWFGLFDVTGKKDRLKPISGPEAVAQTIAAHIKLFELLRKKGYLKDEQSQKMYYQLALEIAEDDYSKLNKDFRSTFWLYMVGLGFLVTLLGAVITFLLSLIGLGSLSPFVILAVTIFIDLRVKFRQEIEIWPWPWLKFWANTKKSCLDILRSSYLEEILTKGTTKGLDKYLPESAITINGIEPSNNDQLQKPEEKEEKAEKAEKAMKQKQKQIEEFRAKRRFKKRKKLWRFLFYLSVVIFVASELTWFCPSVVAKAISLVLPVLKIELKLVIPAIVPPFAFWGGVIALVFGIISYIAYRNTRQSYLQKKFNLNSSRCSVAWIGESLCYNINIKSKKADEIEPKDMWHTKEDLEKEYKIKVDAINLGDINIQ